MQENCFGQVLFSMWCSRVFWLWKSAPQNLHLNCLLSLHLVLFLWPERWSLRPKDALHGLVHLKTFWAILSSFFHPMTFSHLSFVWMTFMYMSGHVTGCYELLTIRTLWQFTSFNTGPLFLQRRVFGCKVIWIENEKSLKQINSKISPPLAEGMSGTDSSAQGSCDVLASPVPWTMNSCSPPPITWQGISFCYTCIRSYQFDLWLSPPWPQGISTTGGNLKSRTDSDENCTVYEDVISLTISTLSHCRLGPGRPHSRWMTNHAEVQCLQWGFWQIQDWQLPAQLCVLDDACCLLLLKQICRSRHQQPERATVKVSDEFHCQLLTWDIMKSHTSDSWGQTTWYVIFWKKE